MNSFYGGLTGQSFKFSAIFPNRVALFDDLNDLSYSSVGLNEFVFINYGLEQGVLDQNLPKDSSYDKNKEIDQDKYGATYNSTLWQKIYIHDLKQDGKGFKFYYQSNTYFISDIEKIDSEQTQGYCYICLGSLRGAIPRFDITSSEVDPNDLPDLEYDYADLENLKLHFKLPRNAKIYFLNGPEAEEVLGDGDILIDKNGQLHIYKGGFGFEPKELYFTPQSLEFTEEKFDTYTADGEVNQTIEGSIVRNEENGSWGVKLKTPQFPDITASSIGINYGNSPEVELTKEESNLHFEFKIPEGPQGDQGEIGPGLEFLPSYSLIYNIDASPSQYSDLEIVKQFVEAEGFTALSYQVLPINLHKVYSNGEAEDVSFWGTYKKSEQSWYLIPLVGASSGLTIEWEEMYEDEEEI